jgi:hypothetical protein
MLGERGQCLHPLYKTPSAARYHPVRLRKQTHESKTIPQKRAS